MDTSSLVLNSNSLEIYSDNKTQIQSQTQSPLEDTNPHKIIKDRLPSHVAIIMDGNGRWAQQRGFPRVYGHREGAKTVRLITEECARLGISQLTLYAFSVENWKRPPREVTYLMALLRKFLVQERDTIVRNNIRFNVIGRLEDLPLKVQKEIEKTKEVCSSNTGMLLCFALSYGGRTEIVDATKKIAQKVASGLLSPESIDEKLFSEHLYQSNMPDPDIVIRTGGEMRLSNFLLWEASYAELWVTPTFWPDFNTIDLYQAFEDYAKRERRFGRVPKSNGA